MGHLHCLEIDRLYSNSWVANEFLNVLTFYDLPEHGLNKLMFYDFRTQCALIEEDLITRLANMCPHISHLELSYMFCLFYEDMLPLASLFRQII